MWDNLPEKPEFAFGTLGFEFAVGQNLLVINPGQNARDLNLQRLLCSTKAHSTVSIDGQDSSDFRVNRLAQISNAELGRAKGGLLALLVIMVMTHHTASFITANYISPQVVETCAGQTILNTRAPQVKFARLAVVRFHLHPRVTAAMLSDQRVLIKIRGNRIGWVFRANATVSLDTSLFFDIEGRMNCQQIVVNAPLADIRSIGRVDIKWAFQRNNLQ